MANDTGWYRELRPVAKALAKAIGSGDTQVALHAGMLLLGVVALLRFDWWQALIFYMVYSAHSVYARWCEDRRLVKQAAREEAATTRRRMTGTPNAELVHIAED